MIVAIVIEKSTIWRIIEDSLQRKNGYNIPSDTPFEPLFQDWVAQAICYLDYSPAQTFQDQLLGDLTDLCAPTLAIELRIASMRNQLKGSTSEKRYQSYLSLLRSDKKLWNLLIEKYPVLFRLINTLIQNWAESVCTFYRRLAKDGQLLSTHGIFGAPISIESVDSDPHNGGMRVIRCLFHNHQTLYYKPRPMKSDIFFVDFIRCCNRMGLQSPLQVCHTIDRGDYGWVKETNISHPCEVKHYFEQIGALITISYTLGAIDLHKENVIIKHNYPIVVDAETLWHQHSYADRQYSVLDQGLLPFFQQLGNLKLPFNLGALQWKEDPIQQLSITVWRNLNSDQLEMTTVNREVRQSPSNIWLSEERGDRQAMWDGLHRTIRFLATNWAFTSECLRQLSRRPTRLLIRPTQHYGCILRGMADPANLTSLDTLSMWLKHLPRLEEWESLRASEEEALTALDVPYFIRFPQTKCIAGYRGRLVNESHTLQTPIPSKPAWLENVRRQARILRYVIYPSEGHRKTKLSISGNKNLLSLAIDIGQLVLSQSKIHGVWQAPDSFYQGDLGTAFYFASLAQVTGDPVWQRACLDLLSVSPFPILVEYTNIIRRATIGGLEGIGGLLYGLFHIGRLLRSRDWTELAYKLALHLPKDCFETTDRWDVMSGSAGLAMSYLTLYRHFADKRLLSRALICGEHAARHVETEIEKGKSAVGFAHGLGGVGSALFRLGHAAKAHQYIDKAMGYWQLEKQYHAQDTQHRDAVSTASNLQSISWCNGAVGIGISRLIGLEHSDHLFLLDAYEPIITQIMKHRHHPPLNLCCGEAGVVEFLASFAQYRNNRTFTTLAQNHLNTLMMKLQESAHEVFDHGLMTGLAGIGYTFLRRSAVSTKLPNLLMLE